MELNLRIRELRKAQGLTLEDLASRIGISVPHLSEVERGKKNLNNHLIKRLAAALGVSPPELIASSVESDIARLHRALEELSEEDRLRVEAFVVALRRSQTRPPQSE
jgi:transcriptional regulator with XRE-family HTH domain